MKTYLRVLNPVLALAIFCLCVYAAIKEENGKIDGGNLFGGGIPTYFFAKGIFCGVAVLLLGKILEALYDKAPQRS